MTKSSVLGYENLTKSNVTSSKSAASSYLKQSFLNWCSTVIEEIRAYVGKAATKLQDTLWDNHVRHISVYYLEVNLT